MKFSDVLNDIGRPVAYYPRLAVAIGNVKATVLLCQFFYWKGKESLADGWIYKTAEDITYETGLSYKEQIGAREKLVSLGLLEERNDRPNHQLLFRVNTDNLNDLWDSFLSDQGEASDKREDGDLQKGSSHMTKGNFVKRNTENTTREYGKDSETESPIPPQTVYLESKKQDRFECPYCETKQPVDLHAHTCKQCSAEITFKIQGVEKPLNPKHYLPVTQASMLLKTATHAATRDVRNHWNEFASEKEQQLWEQTEKQYGSRALIEWVNWAVQKKIPKGKVVQSILTAINRHGTIQSTTPSVSSTPTPDQRVALEEAEARRRAVIEQNSRVVTGTRKVFDQDVSNDI